MIIRGTYPERPIRISELPNGILVRRSSDNATCVRDGWLLIVFSEKGITSCRIESQEQLATAFSELPKGASITLTQD